jgi:two-component system, NtrC family, response regulator AtoC
VRHILYTHTRVSRVRPGLWGPGRCILMGKQRAEGSSGVPLPGKEREQMDFGLYNSMNTLQPIVDSLAVAIYALDRNLTIQGLNTRRSRWLHIEGFIAPGSRECYREVHGRDKPCEGCPVLKTFETGKTERLVMEKEVKGQARYYLLTATPLRNELDEEFSYVIEMVQDITEQKKVEAELKRLNDFNKAIIHNAPVAIFTLDMEGTFTSVNPALAALSGLGSETEERLIGFNWLSNPYTIKSGLANHIKRGLKGEAFQLRDFPHTTFFGTRPHYIDFNGVPLRGNSGEVVGLLCIVVEVTERVTEKLSLAERNTLLQEQLHRVNPREAFIGESKAIREVKDMISLVAASNAPVLILGETGTGKELVARAIHHQSARSSNPFVVINSSSLQEAMVESELFGYKKGAFTGAVNDKIGLLKIANTGTFFMDEVGDLDSSIQAKFLRVLETGVFRRLGDTQETKVDLRFLFATNKSLEEEVKERKFRKDLFYRLNAFTIVVPPLRERKEDIRLLVDYFLQKLARGGPKKVIPQEVKDLLLDYPWPGNVRELANALERIVLISGNRSEIRVEDFPESIVQRSARREDAPLASKPAGDVAELSRIEREYVESVLDSVGGNKSKAARLLGISRRKLYRKIGEA